MRSKTDPVFLDLSAELNDELDWKAGTLRTFDHHLDITAWAYEPLSHLLAIGVLWTSQSHQLEPNHSSRHERWYHRHLRRAWRRISPSGVRPGSCSKYTLRKLMFQAYMRW